VPSTLHSNASFGLSTMTSWSMLPPTVAFWPACAFIGPDAPTGSFGLERPTPC
jgi:hypothetical protein